MNHFENEIARAEYLEEGIITLTFLKDNITLTKEQIIEGWQAAKTLDPTQNSAVLLRTAKYTLIESDARKDALRQMGEWERVAVVVYGLGQKLVGQFAIKLFSRGNKIKLFDDVEDAKIWLRSTLGE